MPTKFENMHTKKGMQQNYVINQRMKNLEDATTFDNLQKRYSFKVYLQPNGLQLKQRAKEHYGRPGTDLTHFILFLQKKKETKISLTWWKKTNATKYKTSN